MNSLIFVYLILTALITAVVYIGVLTRNVESDESNTTSNNNILVETQTLEAETAIIHVVEAEELRAFDTTNKEGNLNAHIPAGDNNITVSNTMEFADSAGIKNAAFVSVQPSAGGQPYALPAAGGEVGTVLTMIAGNHTEFKPVDVRFGPKTSEAKPRSVVVFDTENNDVDYFDSTQVTISSSGEVASVKSMTIGSGGQAFTLPLERGVAGQFLTADANGASIWADEVGLGDVSYSGPSTVVTELCTYGSTDGKTIVNTAGITASSAVLTSKLDNTHDLGATGTRWKDAFVSGVVTVGVSATEYKLPAARGTDTQVMRTDGAGVVSWVPKETMGSGGTNYSLPSARGTDTQVMRTDGSGVVSWVPQETMGSGGTNYSLPSARGTANQVLTAGASGTTSWAAAAGGDVSYSGPSTVVTELCTYGSTDGKTIVNTAGITASSAVLTSSADNTHDLGATGTRWKDVWTRGVTVGASATEYALPAARGTIGHVLTVGPGAGDTQWAAGGGGGGGDVSYTGSGTVTVGELCVYNAVTGLDVGDSGIPVNNCDKAIMFFFSSFLSILQQTKKKNQSQVFFCLIGCLLIIINQKHNIFLEKKKKNQKSLGTPGHGAWSWYKYLFAHQ